MNEHCNHYNHYNHHYKNEQDQDNDDMSLAEVKWNRRTSHLNSKIVKPKKLKYILVKVFICDWKQNAIQLIG